VKILLNIDTQNYIIYIAEVLIMWGFTPFWNTIFNDLTDLLCMPTFNEVSQVSIEIEL